MNARQVDNFYLFIPGDDQGLVELDASDPDYTKASAAKKINAFRNVVVPDQPPFLITREYWELLAKGLHRNRNGVAVSWFDTTKYEVYAFVFCVAFKKIAKTKRAYFRVRTILKEINSGSSEVVYVETDNIAYVDPEIALANQYYQSNPIYKQQNCLVFIDADDFNSNPQLKQLKEDIDREVIRKRGEAGYSPSKIPSSLLENEDCIVKNDGAIFGKYRIWDDLLVKKYHLDKDTLIFLTWDENNKIISFDIRINNDYMMKMPCPPPPVCK